MPSKQPKRSSNTRIAQKKGWIAWLGNKRVLQGLLTGAAAIFAGSCADFTSFDAAFDYFRPVQDDSYWHDHKQEVREVFVTSWDAYSKYAWGK